MEKYTTKHLKFSDIKVYPESGMNTQSIFALYKIECQLLQYTTRPQKPFSSIFPKNNLIKGLDG